MTFLTKLPIIIFLLAWTTFGIRLMIKSNALFGPCRDHRSETPGARSFGITQIVAVWIGAFALGIYFLAI